MPNGQDNTEIQEQISMDEISNKIQEATNELNQLKNSLNELSIEEKNEKIAEIENAILDCSQDLEDLELSGEVSIDENKLNELKLKVDVLKSEKDSLKNQIETQTKLAIDELNQTVTQNHSTEQNQENGDEQEGNDRKGLRGWWSRLNKGQKWGVRIGGVLAGLGIFRLGKRIFGKNDKKETSTSTSTPETKKSRRQLRKERREQRRKERAERRANRPWWQKFLIGSAVAGGTVVGGVQIYKNWNRIKSWVKEKLGLALNFDEAMYTVETEVRNGINKDTNFGNMCAHFEGMSYDENTQEICSFGERVKINKKNKTIEGNGMDSVQFANREELFHAVNIINFAKSNLKGLGSNATPFSINNVTGDIDFSISEGGKEKFISANGSKFWTWVLGGGGTGLGGLLGGYFLGLRGGLAGAVGGGLAGYTIGSVIDNKSTMGRACETISRGANLQKFVGYLNKQGIREGKDQEEEPDSKSPIQPYVTKVRKVIEDSRGSGSGTARELHAEYNEEHPSEILLTSYGDTVKLTLEGNTAKIGEDIDFSKITKISLGKYNDGGEELNIDFNTNDEKGLLEAIRVGNLTNQLRKRWRNCASVECPFSFGKYADSSGYYCFGIETGSWFAGGENYQGGTNILSYKALEKDYPILLKDLEKYRKITSHWYAVNPSQDDLRDQAYKKDKQDEGSQYIKYLHQMGKGRGKYWKNLN